MKNRASVSRFLMAMIVTLSWPLAAQVFDLYEIEMWGLAASDQHPHPKSQTLVLSVPETVGSWRACLEYRSSVDVLLEETRISASCEQWRGGKPIESRNFAERVEESDGYYYSPFLAHLCTCHEQQFEHLEKGDIVRCNLRFKDFAPIPKGQAVHVSLGVAESANAACPEWW